MPKTKEVPEERTRTVIKTKYYSDTLLFVVFAVIITIFVMGAIFYLFYQASIAKIEGKYENQIEKLESDLEKKDLQKELEDTKTELELKDEQNNSSVIRQ